MELQTRLRKPSKKNVVSWPSSVENSIIEGTSKESIDTNIHGHIPNVELGGNIVFNEFSASDQEKINKNHNETSHIEPIDTFFREELHKEVVENSHLIWDIMSHKL